MTFEVLFPVTFLPPPPLVSDSASSQMSEDPSAFSYLREELPIYPAPLHINLELAHSALDWQVWFLPFPIGMGMITETCEPTGKSLSWGLDLDIVRTH